MLEPLGNRLHADGPVHRRRRRRAGSLGLHQPWCTRYQDSDEHKCHQRPAEAGGLG
jgi:hypothetical protein